MTKKEDKQTMAKIRQGLTQYVGAMSEYTAYTGAAARQIVVASLAEEALKLVQVEDHIDLYASKPLLRAVIFILQKRNEALMKGASVSTDAIVQQAAMKKMSEFNQAIKTLEDLIQAIGELKASEKGDSEESGD